MAAPHNSYSDGSGILAEQKRRMRAASIAARQSADPADGVRLAAHVLEELPPPAGAVVAGFLPLRGEIDITPLLTALHARGHPLVLPQTPVRGLPLSFRLWTPGAELIRERFGTMRPTGEVRSPDWLFVPLLAFDRSGARLGYGGGYYDRTLAALPAAVAVGCAFAFQEVPHVPVEPHDVRLAAVATERGVLRTR